MVRGFPVSSFIQPGEERISNRADLTSLPIYLQREIALNPLKAVSFLSFIIYTILI